MEWKGDRAPAALRVVTSYPRDLKPEGICAATLAGRPASVLVFDIGRFSLLEAPATQTR